MYKMLIKQWIPKIQKQDMENFLKKNNFPVSDEELDILYYYLKNRWEDVYEGKKSVFQELKAKLNPTLYQNLYQLYIETKQKLNLN